MPILAPYLCQRTVSNDVGEAVHQGDPPTVCGCRNFTLSHVPPRSGQQALLVVAVVA
jgi:hypothetical protein